jgi:molybdate transport system substrate-binding protein
VQTGNADIGIVALSILKTSALAKIGQYYLVPLDYFPRLEQAAVVARRGTSNPRAAEYIEFLRMSAARTIDRYFFVQCTHFNSDCRINRAS